MKTVLTFILGILFGTSIVEAQVVITSTNNFVTRDQMLLVNEINESGEPFAEALGYNLDDLDPHGFKSARFYCVHFRHRKL